jgi:hypothetical protein
MEVLGEDKGKCLWSQMLLKDVHMRCKPDNAHIDN